MSEIIRAAESLHDKIMHLSCTPPDYMNVDMRHAYRVGHLAGKRAAAELAVELHAVDAPAHDAVSAQLRCTCPSGDGSLRWPCPAHPPEQPERGAVD